MAMRVDLAPYAGRWVAMVRGEVAGVGWTAVDALLMARRNRLRDRFTVQYVEDEAVGRPLTLPPLLDRLRPLLTDLPQPVYLVGGAVRDALLGRVSHDLDFVLPQDAVKLTFQIADELQLPAYVLDKVRDTGRIVLSQEGTYLDFARFRGADLEADLRDRDFTINAMAIPANAMMSGSLIDPWGGQADLAAGVIRAVHDQSLVHDPVRTLRAVRLAHQLGFVLAAETETAVGEAAPLLHQISPERVRDEVVKLMVGDAPHTAVADLWRYGLLAQVLPEIVALADVAQSAPHHEPVLAHTLSVLAWLRRIEQILDENANPTPTDEPERCLSTLLLPIAASLQEHWQQPVDGGLTHHVLLRLAALFHDVGKRETATVDENVRIRFLGHETAGAHITSARMHQLSFSNQAIIHTKKIVAGHMRPLLLAQANEVSRKAAYRYFRTTGSAGLDIAILSLADHLATYNGTGPVPAWESLLNVVQTLFTYYFDRYEEVVAPTLLVNGRDLITLFHLTPGPEVGRLLRLIQEAQAAGEITTREEALALAEQARQ